MSDIVWEDPPERSFGKPKWRELLTPLMDHPGRWAVIESVPESQRRIVTQAQYNLSKKNWATPEGRWEFTTRTVGGGAKLYARYLGPEEEE